MLPFTCRLKKQTKYLILSVTNIIYTFEVIKYFRYIYIFLYEKYKFVYNMIY